MYVRMYVCTDCMRLGADILSRLDLLREEILLQSFTAERYE